MTITNFLLKDYISVSHAKKKIALSKAFREYEQPLPLNISWSIHSNKNLHERKTKWKRGRSVMSYLESFSSGGGDAGAVKLIVAIVISTLRTLPKKSVMSTLPGSLWNRSVRWPGVDTHWLLGHTLNCNTNTRKEQKNHAWWKSEYQPAGMKTLFRLDLQPFSSHQPAPSANEEKRQSRQLPLHSLQITVNTFLFLKTFLPEVKSGMWHRWMPTPYTVPHPLFLRRAPLQVESAAAFQ